MITSLSQRLRSLGAGKTLVIALVISLIAGAQPSVSNAQCQGPAMTFNGEAAGDWFGRSVSWAGDVNNDGYSDLIIGAIYNDVAGTDAGRAYVYSGLTGTLLYTFTGETAGDHFGVSVSGAGDVDNDGYADLIVGAHQNGTKNGGLVYVYSGQTGSLLYFFSSESRFDQFGVSVSGVGDIDKDGYDDFIVGAIWAQGGPGRAYVYSGQTGTLLHIFSGQPGTVEHLGVSVSDAGDVNNDGYPDMIVGAHLTNVGGSTWAGSARVYSGKTWALLHTFTGEAANDNLGISVSSAGDVNKDGYSDLFAGARWNDAGGNNAGRAYVYSGQTGTLLYTFTGEAAGDHFGFSVSGSEDVDNDGYADLVIGAMFNDEGGSDAGKAYVYSGQTGMLLYTITGETAGDNFGFSVSGDTDVNSHEYGDLVVGAILNDVGGSDAGRAYVFACTPPTMTAILDIKPRHCPNEIKIGDHHDDGSKIDGTPAAFAAKDDDGDEHEDKELKVAIVGTSGFDVANVNIATIMFEGVAPTKSKIKDKTQPVADTAACACTRAGKDGIDDLELKFDQSAILATLGTVQDGDVFELTLTGELNDGTAFEGSDCIVIKIDDDDDDGNDGTPGGGTTIALTSSTIELTNYPNPFNPTTEISFSLPSAGHVQLAVYNVAGQQVALLADDEYSAGTHTVTWDASDKASGIYFYRLQTEQAVESRKMLLLK